jgi:hypothetical protein
MLRSDDSLVFQRVTGGIRKPILRFRLASGRNVELLSLHFEPGWAYTGGTPRRIMKEVITRLYPNEVPFVIADLGNHSGTAFLCVAYFCSDRPVRGEQAANYSVLLACGPVENINRPMWSIA